MKVKQRAGSSIRARLRRQWPLYLIMIPGIAYLVINNYLPLLGLQLAFKKYKFNLGIWGSPLNGVKNFTFLFKSADAWNIIRNTLGYNLVFLALGTVVAILVAVLLSEVRSKRMQQGYQTVILIPYLISYVIVSYIAYAFLGQDSGMINNSVLKPLGIEPVMWYTKPGYWPYILTLIHLWKTFGYNSIIYYASIIGIDRTYYEAAVVDGASSWDQIRSITLPMLKPVIITLTLLSIGRIF